MSASGGGGPPEDEEGEISSDSDSLIVEEMDSLPPSPDHHEPHPGGAFQPIRPAERKLDPQAA